MEKQIYTHDQQLDIVSEIIMALEKSVRFAKKKKAKACKEATRDVLRAVILNCFDMDEEDGKKLLDESTDTAVEKNKKRSLAALKYLPERMQSYIQEMVDDGASVSIIAGHAIEDEEEGAEE